MVTTDAFWDCECGVDYIHAKTLTTRCERCYAATDSQPDSHLSEVVTLIGEYRLAQEELLYWKDLEDKVN